MRHRGGLALAALLAVLVAAFTAGALAPAAAAAPDAAMIDAYLQQHGSPMTGTGAAFVAEGMEHGVDPAFLVAITGAETSFGLYLYQEDGDQCTFNAFNWFYGATWPSSDFTSWDEGIARVAEGLQGGLYYGSGLYSVDAIAPKYCPDGTANWVANVRAFMTELGGNPDDTTWDVASITPMPTPSSTTPGVVTLDGSVKLDRGDRLVGESIYAWFTLTNTGTQPVSLEGIRLAVRGPGGADADLISDQALTLEAGQPLQVSASWPLDLAGRWHGWIEVTQSGVTSVVGDDQVFDFWVKLPRDLSVHRWKLRDAALTDGL